MQYLIDHFLRPGAVAKAAGGPQFAGFTFDHQANGVIAGRRQDDRELFLLVVEDDEAGVEVLQTGDRMPWDRYGREVLN